jgi:hypothetical protein
MRSSSSACHAVQGHMTGLAQLCRVPYLPYVTVPSTAMQQALHNDGCERQGSLHQCTLQVCLHMQLPCMQHDALCICLAPRG